MTDTNELRTSLPKITPDILDALEGEVPLIHLWARGPEWTQQAVDFSAMLYPELLAEIDRLRSEANRECVWTKQKTPFYRPPTCRSSCGLLINMASGVDTNRPCWCGGKVRVGKGDE